MTGQISDRLLYNNDMFGILKVSGEGLFNPADYGIKTVALSSACWRGFHCTYEIVGNSLRIQEVYLGLTYLDRKRLELGKFPKIYGKVLVPYEDQKLLSLDYRYENINQLIEFTGGILIANKFIRRFLRPWYFPDVYKFNTVSELMFESGYLAEAIDRSQQISKLREELGDREIDILESQELRRGINNCFNFNYYNN